MAVAFAMNMTGRFMLSQAWVITSTSLLVAGFFALLMVASLVVGLFGLFRLIVGLLIRKKQSHSIGATSPREGVWPPAPQPLDEN